MKTIFGAPSEKWDEVQAVQFEPTVYIQYCGSRWAGEAPGSVEELLSVMASHPLDVERLGADYFITENPCEGVQEQGPSGKMEWVDGEPFYKAPGWYRFSGNFADLSHAFGIDTNDKETIQALKKAIAANIEKFSAVKA